jgi:hypothetical protein
VNKTSVENGRKRYIRSSGNAGQQDTEYLIMMFTLGWEGIEERVKHPVLVLITLT